MKNILEYKSLKVEADRLKISEVLIKELLKFNFEEDYLKEGDLIIENASEITFYLCEIENYTETRSINESIRPNRSGVPLGSKRFSEFNVWDYYLSFDKEFQNSTDNHDILESHHAIGCSTCMQQGKIRCKACRGAGNVTCISCDGRGEKQCGNCNGRVEIKCWSCSGKGTKETGYGENKRTERCSSCYGRGSNKCTRCSNGFITCFTCGRSGKVTCYNCHGSGEVTCYQCDGNRTMDHFFIVSANFINLSQTLYLTNPYPGFDQNKSKTTIFNTQNKLFEIQEPRFTESYFNDIKSSPFYRQITSFLDFTDNNRTKLIASRITFFENKYFEVIFNFYGEKYTIFLDKNFENSYYDGKKPSDQYELDLLKKSIDSILKNELSVTKKTIQKLSKYDFISISEKKIISAIEDTEYIYEAFDECKNKNYVAAENSLRLVSDLKKSEEDFLKLRKKLNKTYFKSTTIFGIVSGIFICFKLFDKDYEFQIIQFSILLGIISICWLLNRFTKNIQYARWLVVLLILIQFSHITYMEFVNGDEIKSENQKIEDFKEFKKDKIILSIDNSNISLFLFENLGLELPTEVILLDEDQNVDDFKYDFVIKPGFVERWYSSRVTIPNLVVKEQRKVYSDNDLKKILLANPNPNDEIILRDWESNLEFYAKISDLYLIEFVTIKIMFNDLANFENKFTYVVKMPKYIYDLLKQHKSIEKYSFSNIPSKSIYESGFSTNNTLQIGSLYQGGIIVQLDETGQHGMIMSEADLGSGDWNHAVLLCNEFSNAGSDDWRLPTIEELHLIYANKSLTNNFEQNWYWSSTEDTENSDYAFNLGFISGEEMSIPKQDDKFIRAVRNF
jgi:hypothetical protein